MASNITHQKIVVNLATLSITITMDTFSPPPLAPDQNPCALSPATPMGAEQWWCIAKFDHISNGAH
jgi:hypothetical protein